MKIADIRPERGKLGILEDPQMHDFDNQLKKLIYLHLGQTCTHLEISLNSRKIFRIPSQF